MVAINSSFIINIDFSISYIHISNMRKNYKLITKDTEEINITLYSASEKISNNFLFFVHGFKGFKDWGFGPYLGEYFAQNGFTSILFNFSHNGVKGNSIEFTELDKFSKNTFSREIGELNELIDAAKHGFFEGIVPDKIGLIGHSRGGAISLLTAYQRSDLNSIALWASVSNLDRYSERQKEVWRKKGVFEVLNHRTKQIMSLGLVLLEDLEKNKNSSLNIKKAINSLKIPIFIGHGEQDLAVKIKEAEELYTWSKKETTEFIKISTTGHTFDMVHPHEKTNEKFEYLLSKTLLFFKRNFY
ncbi:MAG: alpha/beta hydrolase [Melioribacteraceae bacterium]|nr:alpha/beta hydrolase [Melioribacteraceae bacterium]